MWDIACPKLVTNFKKYRGSFSVFEYLFGEYVRPVQTYRGLSGSGPEMPKSLENVSRDPKKSQKSLKKVSGQSGKSPESVFGVFRDFLETPGAGGPGRHFRDSFGISGLEGPRDELCKGRAGSQASCAYYNFRRRTNGEVQTVN